MQHENVRTTKNRPIGRLIITNRNTTVPVHTVYHSTSYPFAYNRMRTRYSCYYTISFQGSFHNKTADLYTHRYTKLCPVVHNYTVHVQSSSICEHILYHPNTPMRHANIVHATEQNHMKSPLTELHPRLDLHRSWLPAIFLGASQHCGMYYMFLR